MTAKSAVICFGLSKYRIARETFGLRFPSTEETGLRGSLDDIFQDEKILVGEAVKFGIGPVQACPGAIR